MKRIPPYIVVALCGLLFVSAGLIGMFANNTEEIPVEGAEVVVVLPSETPTLTPLPVEVVVEQPVDSVPVSEVQPLPTLELPTATPTETPTVVVPPVEGTPVVAAPVDGAPVVPPVDGVPAEVPVVEQPPVDGAPVVIVTAEVVPPEQPLPDGVVPIPTAIDVVPTEQTLPEVVVPIPTAIPTEVVPVEEVPLDGRDTIPVDDAAPVPTQAVPVDTVTEPTPETPASGVIVPEQPLPTEGAPVVPTLDPAIMPTAETIAPTVVPVDVVSAAGAAQLSGVITFQDAQDHTGINILLTLPDGTQLQNTTGAPGTFEFLSLRPGTYKIEATATGYLSRQVKFTLADGQSLQLPETFLVGGDTNFDNIIDLSDAAMVAVNFDGPAVDITSDPNRDGWIDVRDLALIGADFGLTGPIPWQ